MVTPDADGITVRINHRCQMAGRVLPVRCSLFGNSIGGRDGEHRQVGAEAVGVYPYPADNSEGVLSRLFLQPQRSITFLICNSVCGMLQ